MVEKSLRVCSLVWLLKQRRAILRLCSWVRDKTSGSLVYSVCVCSSARFSAKATNCQSYWDLRIARGLFVGAEHWVILTLFLQLRKQESDSGRKMGSSEGSLRKWQGSLWFKTKVLSWVW